jgi:hypothetical protein
MSKRSAGTGAQAESMAAQTDKDVNLSVFIILPPKRRGPPMIARFSW